MAPFQAGGMNVPFNVTTSTANIPPDPRDFAPGLQMSDLDALLREHYAKGHRDGAEKAWKSAHVRIADEREKAAAQAAEKAKADLLQWMWPNVMHKVLSASERAASVLGSPKSTIANDREQVQRILDVLKQSLHTFHHKQPQDSDQVPW